MRSQPACEADARRPPAVAPHMSLRTTCVRKLFAYNARMKSAPLNAVLRLIRAQSHLQNRFTAELGAVHGLSVNELMLLMHLERTRGGRLRRVDLADRLDLSQSSVTRMLVPMEKVGWVDRAEDARDGRVTYVVLTPCRTAIGQGWREDALPAVGHPVRRSLDREGSRNARPPAGSLDREPAGAARGLTAPCS